MSTTAVNSSSSTSATVAAVKKSNSSMDTESFIKILAAQLRYQDPTDPVKASEYVSQLAQISSLSELEGVNTGVNNNSAYSMIGKTATYSVTDSAGTTTTGSGIVNSVSISGSNTTLDVGGTPVSLKYITKVTDTSSTKTTA